MDDPNAQTREALCDYLSRPAPGFAVLMAAPWGAGKTHLIREMIKSFKEKPLFVSLFGVEDNAGARRAIAREAIGSEAEKALGAWNKLAGMAEKFSGVQLAMSLSDAASLMPMPGTLILDDLERSGMAEIAQLGLINDLVERQGRRVVVLANEAKLWPDGRAQKEKIIGLTLPVRADVGQALPLFLAELPEPTGRFLMAESGLISNVFHRANHHNLRALRQSLFDFHRVYMVLDDDLRQVADGMREFLNLYLTLALEVKAGAVTPEELRLRDSYAPSHKPEFAHLRELTNKHDRQDVLHGQNSVMPGALSERLLMDGVVVASEIREALIASGQFITPLEEEWVVVWWASQRNPIKVMDAFCQMERRFDSRQYLLPGVILHVFHLRLSARHMGLTDKTPDQVVRECHAYIDDLLTTKKLQGLRRSRASSFDESGYAGLGYPRIRDDDPYPEDTLAFWHLHDRLRDAQIALFDSSLAGISAGLVGLIAEGNVAEVAACLWQAEDGREGDMRRVPVLAKTDPTAMAAAIASLEGKALVDLGRVFEARYELIGTELDDELVWLPMLVEAMRAEADKRRAKYPVHSWQIRKMVRWSLEKPLSDRASDR